MLTFIRIWCVIKGHNCFFFTFVHNFYLGISVSKSTK